MEGMIFLVWVNYQGHYTIITLSLNNYELSRECQGLFVLYGIILANNFDNPPCI